MSRQWHIIGYDVCNPKRLRRVARILEGYGQRIQYSLFCVQASVKQIERLRWELSQVVEDEDHILIVGLCSKCSHNVMEQSGSIRWDAEPPSFQIVGGKFKDEDALDENKA
ncbi:MAG: CRISPR-associated endonuclease Cas2 [Candidatus Omnitrophica bacterium]|nr:CRISPR-associated endonuclease Cas2 [Candidatus Omnitrophota bacterium]